MLEHKLKAALKTYIPIHTLIPFSNCSGLNLTALTDIINYYDNSAVSLPVNLLLSAHFIHLYMSQKPGLYLKMPKDDQGRSRQFRSGQAINSVVEEGIKGLEDTHSV